MRSTPSRRRLLRWVGAGLAASAAGCTGGGDGSDPDSESPDDGSDPDSESPDDGSDPDSESPGGDSDTGGHSPTPTASTAPGTGSSPTATGTDTCDRATPRPVPDLSVINRTDEEIRATVTVTSSSGSEVYDEAVTVPADEEVDRFDVFPAEDTYRIAAELPDGRSTTKEMDAERNDRYGIVTVTVRADEVFVERLGVHPKPTATPCPE